jgi:hypothetical protein
MDDLNAQDQNCNHRGARLGFLMFEELILFTSLAGFIYTLVDLNYSGE